VLLAFALGGISVMWWRGVHQACPPAESAAPSATASRSGETPGPSQVVVTPQPTTGGTGAVQIGDASFVITGSVGNLVPGVPMPIRLTLINPNDIPIHVTSLTVRVADDSTPPGCRSADNIRLTQSDVSGADPISIAAKSSVTVTSPPRAPEITLLNLPGVNQDICKNKTFALTYSGSAHS
jgi:hypothetical protein